MKKIIYFIILSYFIICKLSAQDIFIASKIIDNETKKGVPFANIYIQNNGIGTASNEEGNFVLKIPNQNKKDTIIISSIGYKTQYFPIFSFLSNTIIRLEADKVVLGEVTIKELSAYTILEISLNKITTNYADDNQPSIYTLYSRETTKINDNTSLLVEWISKIYRSKEKNEHKVEKIRAKYYDESGQKRLKQIHITGLMGSFFLFNRKNIKKIYKNIVLKDILIENKDTIYVIEAEVSKRNIRYEIVKKDFGIRCIISKEKKKKNPTTWSFYYRKINDYWFFHRKTLESFGDDYTTELIYQVVDVIHATEESKFSTLSSNPRISTLIEDFKDTFWQNYNYIQLDEK